MDIYKQHMFHIMFFFNAKYHVKTPFVFAFQKYIFFEKIKVFLVFYFKLISFYVFRFFNMLVSKINFKKIKNIILF
jgi:hypothetical protein